MMFQTGGQTASPAPADDLIKDTTTQGFREDVIQASMKQPVLVDFWAPWCGPCKQLAPAIEKVVKAAGGKVKLVKMNIDEHPQIAGQLGIQSIPAVIAFQRGQPVDGFMGAVPESQIRGFIERLVGPVGPGAVEQLLAQAGELATAGDVAGASEIYAAILTEEPNHVGAIAAMAKLQLDLGQIENAKAVIATVPADKANDPAVAAVQAALALAEQAGDLGEIAELEKRVAADPKDHQARIELAIALNAKNRREEAVDHLVASIRADRKWNDEAARKQLLQFFEAWGHGDDDTVAGRRKLSSALFA